VRLTAEEYARLQHVARLRKAPHFQVVRAKILLAAYEHAQWSNPQIAAHVGCSVVTVRRWRAASQKGPQLQDAARSGAPRFFLLPYAPK
jgi:transposase